ncbi:DUF3089 domain-containing protein [Maridesulfovibrio salexigens]|uniref:DUF3089 domain-containing protein n=1 Tax=Maridesulfovibrio salexigens (strain ATCC 14822 / DSM 2638 / NCIMB 8403 / VKM B-1763) TaxID=526222 RepID=C6BRR8_MARSD|nr:DUF3089 domain-containing protein [Maridesulfovibrio salexigens]ACS79508.1 conserved hypothetical protein [Maridesulfovibrio salexigens DSM 2638]
MPVNKFITYFILAIVIFGSSACNIKKSTPLPNAPDYSEDKLWSIKDENIRHKIDVFFVHPTTYGPPANGHLIADLNDQKLNRITDRDTVQWITGAFAESCNVFAPRYRQMNIEVLQMDDRHLQEYLKTPVADIENAFKYYLNNINNGRPFILASHSQGSFVLQTLLRKNPELLDKSKLVAAYMPGWTFTDQDLHDLGLKLSEKPDQTGCLITWNTIGPGGESPTIKKGARCVNPLSWSTATKEFPASMNIKAKIFLSPEKKLLIKNFTAARINKDGALEVPTPKPAVLSQLNMSLGKEVYHRYDYDFFFYNVQENVKQRCAAYLKEHK